MLVSTLMKESGNAAIKADIFEDTLGFTVNYHSGSKMIRSTTYQNMTLEDVEKIAHKWVENTQVLKG